MPFGIKLDLFGEASNAAIAAKPENQRAQVRELTKGMKAQIRNIDRDIRRNGMAETKASREIKKYAESRSDIAAKNLAREVARNRAMTTRLHMQKSHLSSCINQIQGMAATMKVADTIKLSTQTVQAMNAAMSLPENKEAMKTFQKEMLKAGLIEEETGEAMDEALAVEDEEEVVDEEVAKVLAELGVEVQAGVAVPTAPAAVAQPEAAAAASKENDELTARLRAL